MEGDCLHRSAINLMWTGGWDSTFQLLDLLLDQKREVTPYYLVDSGRPSADMEKETMAKISERLVADYPFVEKLLAPIIEVEVGKIPPDEGVSDAYRAIRNDKELGAQYDFLSRFCKANAIENMHLCVHAECNHAPSHYDFDDVVSEVEIDGSSVWRIDSSYAGSNDEIIFKYYVFPIIKLTKAGMKSLAEDKGWMEIMRMTWFCHTPTKYMKPCGKCSPCCQVIKEEFGWRIPPSGWVTHYIHKILIKPLKRIAKALLKR